MRCRKCGLVVLMSFDTANKTGPELFEEMDKCGRAVDLQFRAKHSKACAGSIVSESALYSAA